MKKVKRARIITASLIMLLLMSLTGLLILQQVNRSLHEQLDTEKLRSEALLSEKLSIEKSRDKNTTLNEKLQRDLVNVKEALTAKAKVVSTQTIENKRIKRALRLSERNLLEARSANKHLQAKLTERENAHDKLDSVYLLAADSVNELKANVAYLQKELDENTLRSIDQTLISGVKKNNDKITSKARSIKKLVANVTVPGVLDDLNFVVEGPDGAVLSHNGSLTARMLEDNPTLTASNNENIYTAFQPRQIEVTYVPDGKLRPGTYTFKIFNKAKYVGSMKVKLR